MIYTTPNKDECQTLAHTYGFADPLQLTPLSGGQENSNFRFSARGQRFVLTICENKPAAKARLIARTLQYLADHQFRTSRLLTTTNGASTDELRGKPVLVKQYLPGEVKSAFTGEAELQKIGLALGRLHRVPPPDFLPNDIDYGVNSFATIADQWSPPDPFLDELTALAREVEPYLLPGVLPRTLIHADLFPDNIVFDRGGQPTIMDFEEAAVYVRLFDVGMAIIGCCSTDGKVAVDKQAALMRGLSLSAPLSKAERDALPLFTRYAAMGMASWRFRQFRILHPELGKQETYRELWTLADSVPPQL